MTKSRGIGKGKNPKSHNMRHNKIRNPAKLNRFVKEELVSKVIDWACEGVETNKRKLIDSVISHSPIEITRNDATAIIRFAMERLAEITKQDAPIVIANHIELYEKVWAYFNSIGYTTQANRALKQKEKLMGVFKKTNRINVNQKRKVVITTNVQYDLNKLSETEKLRLKELIQKAK